MENAKEFLTLYKYWQENFYSMGVENVCFVSKEQFDCLAEPLRLAVKKAGLKLTSGKILYKNNHPLCRFLLMPKRVLLYPTEDGNCQSKWIDLVIIKATYKKKENGYYVKVCKAIPDIMSYELYGQCEITGKAEAFNSLLKMYGFELSSYSIAKYSDSVSLWGVWMGNQIYYATYIDWSGRISDDTNIDKNLPLVTIPIESVFFSATLFSLCKPLYAFCKLKNIHYDFALQILLDNELSSSNGEPTWPYWALDCYADMWCNFREWTVRKKKAAHLQTENIGAKFQPKISKKFRNRWTDLKLTASWQHLNFPLVYSDRERVTWGDKSFSFYKSKEQAVPVVLSKKQLKKINLTSTLPILMPTVSSSKSYSSQECLTFVCDEILIGQRERVRESYRIEEIMCARHERLLNFYTKVLQILNGMNAGEIRKPLLAAYHKALNYLGASKKDTSFEQQHKACLLGSMYFIKANLSGEDGKYPRFASFIHCVERIFRCEATLTDFATFVSLARGTDSSYHSAVLKVEEKVGIYLNKEEYWVAFQSYCKEKEIKLFCTELQFRKRELIPGGYLKPQYEVADPNQYARYDYRKVIDGKKRIVLNVDWKILKKAKDNSLF